jgi:RsbT co-antagonist protein rsbRD N-terminal domain
MRGRSVIWSQLLSPKISSQVAYGKRLLEELLTNPSDELRECAMGESKSGVLVAGENNGAASSESVADILESQLDHVIQEWLARVEKEPDLTSIPLNFQERTGHLPQLLHDVIRRLRLDDETQAPISQAAAHHGDLRSKQGYTVAMAVEESRLLQVSIFSTLHRSQKHLDFSKVLPAVVTIADEVDAQLKQQMLRFMAADDSKADKAAMAAKTAKLAQSA